MATNPPQNWDERDQALKQRIDSLTPVGKKQVGEILIDHFNAARAKAAKGFPDFTVEELDFLENIFSCGCPQPIEDSDKENAIFDTLKDKGLIDIKFSPMADLLPEGMKIAEAYADAVWDEMKTARERRKLTAT
jgi:hypothetical protein